MWNVVGMQGERQNWQAKWHNQQLRPFYIKKNGPITPRNMWSPVGRDAILSGDKMGSSVLKHDWYSTPLIHVNMADIFRMRWRISLGL
jgi:hypothetical protein